MEMQAAMPSRDSVIADVTALVANSFDRDWKKAFDHYSDNGRLSRNGLMNVLKDANAVGTFLRGTVADNILAEIDADKDGYITFAEFESITSK